MSAQEGEGWSLSKDKDGIRVYRKPMEGSAFDAVKAEMRVVGRLEAALAVIWDIGRYPEWMPHTDAVEVLEKEPGRLVYYLKTDVPWPATDRDGIYDIRVSGDERSAGLAFVCRPDRLEERKGYVRIPSCNGNWELQFMEKDEIRITYEMQSQMGGSIPGWLANMGATQVPFRMLRELRRRMLMEEYQAASFPFP